MATLSDTYEALTDSIRAAAGPDVPERLMAAYTDPEFIPCTLSVTGPPDADGPMVPVCSQCSAVVPWAAQDGHLDWHRKLTLGIRGMALAMLAEVAAVDDGEPA